MIKEGKGCHRDAEIANHIIWDLYHDNVKYFCQGNAASKFADIALRMGNLFKDGIGCTPDPMKAYGYYLMADHSIRLRRSVFDRYGDDRVEDNIKQALVEVAEAAGMTGKPARTVRYYTLKDVLTFALGHGRRVRMDYRWTKKGKLKMTFTVDDKPGTRYRSKFPVCFPQAHFCGLVERLNVTVVKVSGKPFGLKGRRGSVVFDEVCGGYGDWGALLLYGKKVAHVQGVFCVDCHQLKGKKRRYASVTFDDPHRHLDYLCNNPDIQAGVAVTVPCGDRMRKGTVLRVNDRCDSDVELWQEAYKWIDQADESC